MSRLILTSLFILLGVPGVLGGQKTHLQVRGIYGGVPVSPGEELDLSDLGVNAIFLHSGRINRESVEQVKLAGGKIFAEFNTLHFAEYVKEYPDAAPVGPDGQVSPPPNGWQGVCPTHPGYRLNRMSAFRSLLRDFELDGIWLDYHHGHSSWERADPVLPDTCFCSRCLKEFEKSTGIVPRGGSQKEKAGRLLTEFREPWIQWRCDLLTDWVREFREILDSVRPEALLGTFHCPWSDDDREGARLNKLAIDLRAQARFIDVFSPMPYHARFGFPNDPDWISRQVSWLGDYLNLKGRPEEEIKIWPIVQLSDWGESVPVEQIEAVLDLGSRLPATGVLVFSWGGLGKQPEKVEEVKRVFRRYAREAGSSD